MQQAEQQIQSITQKIQQLLKSYDVLETERNLLRKKVEELKDHKQQQSAIIEELQQKLLLIKSAKTELDGDEKKALEKRLSEYIKEIDRCIVMLGE